jgi:hypothetical protein
VWTIAAFPAATTWSSSAFERATSKSSVRATCRSILAIIASRHSHAVFFSSIRPPPVKCAAKRSSLQPNMFDSGTCRDDHTTFSPPFSSILKSVRLASGLKVPPVK